MSVPTLQRVAVSAIFGLSSLLPAFARSIAAEAPTVEVVPDGDAASVLDVLVQNVQPSSDGGKRITLVFKNKKAVVYNLTIRPGLTGIPEDTPLLPVMAKRDLAFQTVVVPLGTVQTIQASKVGLDSATTEKLLLLDILTVAEVAVSGEYPPTPDTLNDFLLTSVGGTILDDAVSRLHDGGVDLTLAIGKMSQDPPDVAGAAQDVLSAMQDAPDAFTQLAADIGWKGALKDPGKVAEAVQKLGVAQFLNSLAYFGDMLFAPHLVTFSLRLPSPETPLVAAPAPEPQPVPAPEPPPVAVLQFDPLLDFSANQGARGWYFQALNPRDNSYLDLPSFGQPAGSTWGSDPPYICKQEPCYKSWNSDRIPWVEVGTRPTPREFASLSPWAVQFHPGTGGWEAVLSWKAPRSGSLELRGEFMRVNTCGDGVHVSIWQNATPLYERDLTTAPTRLDFNLAAVLSAADWIHIRVGARANNNCDATQLLASLVLGQ